MRRRLFALIEKEFIQLSRDRRTIAVLVIAGGLELLLFAAAVHTDITHIPLVVGDQSLSADLLRSNRTRHVPQRRRARRVVARRVWTDHPARVEPRPGIAFLPTESRMMDRRAQRMRGLIRRETMQLLRDRRLLAFMLGLPLLQVLLYGYAVHFSVYHLPMAVVDESHDARSREFVPALVNSQYVDATQQLDSEDQAVDAIDRGDVKAGVVIPDRFATRTDKGWADALFILDGSDSASVQSGCTAAVLVAQDYALQLARLQRAIRPPARALARCRSKPRPVSCTTPTWSASG
jgi:hypothetical protein